MKEQKIESLRSEINQIDDQLFLLIQKRMKIAEKIGLIKNKTDADLRDFEREKICIDFAQQKARDLNLSKELATNLMHLLMRESLTFQEKNRLTQAIKDNQKRALIIGGAGKMGHWFAQFLASQGYYTSICDPTPKKSAFTNIQFDQIRNEPFDIYVVATPLSKTNQVLLELAKLPIKGLVVDIASLKGLVKEGVKSLLSAGIQTASIHPMFGPQTKLLLNQHVICIELKDQKAEQKVKKLFKPTAATLHKMEMDEHDLNIAYLLGLSHATNILFTDTLASSGKNANTLQKLSSTTFDAQMQVASKVMEENPELYYEIQALNAFGDAPLSNLSDRLDEFRKLISDKNKAHFTQKMINGKEYLRERPKRETSNEPH